MKKTIHYLLLLASSAVFLTGCVNEDGTQNNTGTGALFGAGLGALIGAAAGGRSHGGQDALIGAAAGAVAGGLIGNSADHERDARLRQEGYIEPTPMGVADVKALARSGVSEDVIITQIQTTHTVFHLSASDIIDLRNAGVSDRIVNFMINTPNTITPVVPPTSEVVVEQAPPAPLVDAYVAAPGPDYIWVNGEWSWDGLRWVWVGGHWMYPPRVHAVWVGGYRWHDGYGWHYVGGHWR